ncbi:MAG: hypothetical protein WB711_01140 [Terriglobales bacterium]
MNGIKKIGPHRLLASSAMLFGAMFTIMLLPAYGQQDVSPDWYDPAPSAVVHPAQAPAVAHSSQSSVATHQYQQTAKSLSPAANASKAHVKDAQLDQRSHNAARKMARVPSVGLVACAEPTALHANQHECSAEDDLAYQPVASVERSAGSASAERR